MHKTYIYRYFMNFKESFPTDNIVRACFDCFALSLERNPRPSETPLANTHIHILQSAAILWGSCQTIMYRVFLLYLLMYICVYRT